MNKYKIIKFPKFTDKRGDLIPFELDQNFPFKVKRVYLVTSKNNSTRGGHAHKIESEVFVAAKGKITALINDGTQDIEIVLDDSNKALLVQKHCWHEFHDFSEDAVMLCFSSTHYLPGEENYITDKEAFLNS